MLLPRHYREIDERKQLYNDVALASMTAVDDASSAAATADDVVADKKRD